MEITIERDNLFFTAKDGKVYEVRDTDEGLHLLARNGDIIVTNITSNKIRVSTDGHNG